MSNLKHYLVITFLLLSACGGGGDSKLPPKPIIIPDTDISGILTLGGPIKNADVTIYEFLGRTVGVQLAQSEVKTNSFGEFNIILKTESKPILICMSSGLYSEEASINSEITVEPGQRLCSVVNYTSGEKQNVIISYFTNLATGLASNMIHNNKKVRDAIIEANDRISSWVGVNVITTKPIQITATTSISETQLSDSIKYGFANASVSSLVRWAGIESGQAAFKGVTSMSFAQISYDDINSSGTLNGNGQAGLISIGTVPLTEKIYRHNLALNILAMTSSSKKIAPFSYNDILPFAKNFNDTLDPIFSDAPIVGITNSKLQITNVSPSYPKSEVFVLSGVTNNITATITSESAINTVSLMLIKPPAIAETMLATASDNYLPAFNFDSTQLNDGSYKLKLIATDILGNSAIHEFPNIIVSNLITEISSVTPIALTPLRGNFQLAANLSDSFGISSVSITSGKTSFPVTLNTTGTQVVATVNTRLLGADGIKTFTITAQSNESTRAPAIKKINYLVDNTSPIASFTNIETNQTLPPTILTGTKAIVIGNSSDVTSGIDNVIVSLTGQPNIANVTSTNPDFNIVIDTTVAAYKPDGIKLLEINSHDKAGNHRHVPLNVIVDNTPASITVNSPVTGKWYQNITIDAQVSDGLGGGVASSKVIFDNKPARNYVHTGSYSLPQLITQNIILNQTPSSVTFQNLDEKLHSLNITSVDRAAISSIPTLVTGFGYDVTDPTYTLTTVTAGISYSNNGVVVDTTGKLGGYHIITNAEMGAEPFCRLDFSSLSDPGYSTNTGSGLHSLHASSFNSVGEPLPAAAYNSTAFPIISKADQSYALPNFLRLNVPLGGGAIPPTGIEQNAMINSTTPGAGRSTVRFPSVPLVRKFTVTLRDQTAATGSANVDFKTDTYCVYWQAEYFNSSTYVGFANLCIQTVLQSPLQNCTPLP